MVSRIVLVSTRPAAVSVVHRNVQYGLIVLRNKVGIYVNATLVGTATIGVSVTGGPGLGGSNDESAAIYSALEEGLIAILHGKGPR